MALKNMIKVGDRVTFGRSGDKKKSGTVVKCNPKTARVKVPRDGEYLVTYNLIQKPRKKKASGKKVCASPTKKVRSQRKPKPNPGLADLKAARSEATTRKKRKAYGAAVASKRRRMSLGKKAVASRKVVAASASYKNWLKTQTTTKLRSLAKSLDALTAAPIGAPLGRDAEAKLEAVYRELKGR